MTLLINLSSCDYELSPWQTDVDCPGRTLSENLAWLSEIEATKRPNSRYRVALIGDPQQFPGDLELTIKAINIRQNIDFIILLGDLVETGVKPEFEWACKALNLSRKPIIPVIGNHDALSYGKDIWLKIFGEFDYSFSYLGTKFVAYNDNQYEFENVPDRQWIATEAEKDQPEDWNYLIGMSHIPPWGRDPELGSFMANLGYDITLHAHRHRFQYVENSGNGMPYFVTADTQEVKFAILTVEEEGLTIEQCEPECIEVATIHK